MPLIERTDRGLYCAAGDFYIDPWRPVKRALITHAHGDHARFGHKYYLSHYDTIPIMQVRLGKNNLYEGIGYGVSIDMNGVKVSFHPAGHIIGSAQIKVEYRGEVWVVSGDYKVENDGISGQFEVVPCHTFITESTFGLPIYKWQPQENIFSDIHRWWRYNQEKGMATVLTGYALGKAQRLLYNLDLSIGPVYLHTTIYNLNRALIDAGFPIPDVPRVDPTLKKDIYRKALILAPPSAAGSAWLRRFQPFSLGMCSGWMALRGTRRWQAADKGFALSDHADWTGLNETIKATGAERVLVTHGYSDIFSRWLRMQGLQAQPLETQFEDEEKPEPPSEASETLSDEEAAA